MASCRPPITDPPTPHPEAFSSMKQHSPYHQPESNAHWQKGCTPRGSLQGPRPVCGWVEGAGPCSQSKSPRASITGTRDAFTVASLKGDTLCNPNAHCHRAHHTPGHYPSSKRENHMDSLKGPRACAGAAATPQGQSQGRSGQLRQPPTKEQVPPQANLKAGRVQPPEPGPKHTMCSTHKQLSSKQGAQGHQPSAAPSQPHTTTKVKWGDLPIVLSAH